MPLPLKTCENESKSRLRKDMRRCLRAMSIDRQAADSGIVKNLEKLLGTLSCGVIAAYAAMPTEPDLSAFLSRSLADGRPVCFPCFDESQGVYGMVEVQDMTTQLRPGRYGILEPLPTLPVLHPPFVSSTPWLWLVPALGYDLGGHRLGHGGGYYDRLLGGANGVKVGVAYECQLVDSVPFEVHDIRMDYVVTESRQHFCE